VQAGTCRRKCCDITLLLMNIYMQVVGIEKILFVISLLLIARNMFNMHESYVVHIRPLITLFYVKIRLILYIYICVCVCVCVC